MNKTKFSPNTTRPINFIDISRKTKRVVFRLCCFFRRQPGFYSKLFSAVIVFLFILAPSTAKAASFSITSSSTLSAVQLTELGLSGSGTAYNEGSYDANVTWGGVVSSPLSSFDQVYTGSTVQRTNVLLWYYQYNKNTETLPTFTPTYRIFSKTGNIENTLSNSVYTSSTVNATITSQPITTSKYSGNTWRAYGYATITVDLTSARRSGTYKGVVQISIIYI
ncbi:MAG: hypothetical protein HGA70_04300 [Chlorobiaceae bacterium]|nr:hypothetical protein [Chlorobiaceae bacterium]